MVQLRPIALILCLFFPFFSAFAQDDYIFQDPQASCYETFRSCKTDPVAKAKVQHWDIEAKLCIDDYRTNKCEETIVATAAPEDRNKLRSKMKSCTAYGQCQEQNQDDHSNDGAKLKACFWNAPNGIVWDLVKGNADLLMAGAAECFSSKDRSKVLSCSTNPMYLAFYSAYALAKKIPGPSRIYNIGKEWVKKQGVKLECFSPEAQIEMICYGVISALAPGAISKTLPEVVTLTKLGQTSRITALAERSSVVGPSRIEQLKNRASVNPLLKEKPLASARGQGLNVPRKQTPKGKPVISATADAAKTAAVPAVLTTREAFSEKYVSKTFATEAQNEKWVQLASQTDPPPGTRFFDVENSVMKKLNDTTLDKNFVTALTNQHKELVIGKMDALAKKYPGVDFVRYSDFKSVRYAVVPKPPTKVLPHELELEIANAFKQSNGEFAKIMEDQKLVPKGEDAKWWFRGGWGDTADEATIASRYSRNAPDTNQMRRFTDADLIESQTTTLKYAEAYRANVQSSLKSTSLLESSSVDGKMIPRAEVFDAIRKTQTPEQLASFIKKTTGESISVDQAKTLRTYSEMTDEFSPGIHVVRREQAILDKPTGGITFDLVGAGSENSQATAKALAKAKDVESAVREARFGERSVTENLNQRKAEIKNTVTPILEKYKIKAKFVTSGDDMAVIPETPIPAVAKKEIAEALAKTQKPSSVRMSSVDSGISNVTDRMVMVTQGESVEKATRKYLQGALPREILDKTVVSVQMEGQSLGQGNVRLVLGQGVHLTTEQKNAFNAAFEKAVKDLKANYKPVN